MIKRETIMFKRKYVNYVAADTLATQPAYQQP